MANHSNRRAGTAGRARRRGAALLLGALVLVLGGAPPVVAQPRRDAQIAAEALFEDGHALMAAQKYAEACDKFEASHKLDPSVGALLNIGNCREKLGQSATAWGSFRQAAALARERDDREREQFALARADALEKQLSYLIIEVPDPARVPDLVVTRNGKPVLPALWGQRAPVDPGAHEIRAEAPGHLPYQAGVEVAPGPGETRAIIPALTARVDSTAPGQTAAAGRNPRQRDAGGPGPSLGRKIALAGAAVGLVGLAGGSVLGLQARSMWSEARDTCVDGRVDRCPPDAVARSEDAVSKGNQATVVFSAGLAAAAAAAILWYASAPEPSGSAGQDTVRIEPMAGPRGLGAQVHLRF